MIELKNLQFSYSKSRKIFEGLDISISRGGICGLLGKNGVGKTTLLHLISGLLKPDFENSIKVVGEVPFKRTVNFLGSIFLVPEEFSLPRTTIVNYARSYGKFYPRFSMEQMMACLEELDVKADEVMNIMSFGQRKKAYIAFAIACNTDILLLDEPTNGLDIPSKVAFRRAMARFADEDRTIVISTHQVRDLEEILDSVVVLKNEGVLLQASVSEITRRLRFEVVEPDMEVIYSQPSIHGTIGVVENHCEDNETVLDMELLFNAVSAEPEKIAKIFNK